MASDNAPDSQFVTVMGGLRLRRRQSLSQEPRGTSDPGSNSTQGSTHSIMAGRSSSGLPLPTEVSHITSHVAQPTTITTDPPTQALEPHVCDNSNCAASRVWETTELLEHIFTFLPTNHLLPLRSVKRSWNGLILKSPYLRLHLFVHANWQHPAAEFRLLPLSLPGLEIRRGNPVHLGHWIEVHINIDAAENILEDATDRKPFVCSAWFAQDFESRAPPPTSQTTPVHSDLVITQPPVVGMQAFIVDADTILPDKPASTSSEDDDDQEVQNTTVPAVHSKISCDAGITLGFVASVAQTMLAPSLRSKNPAQRKITKVIFTAIVSYCQSDTAPRKRSGTRMVTAV